jgi:hypothetical protein
MNIQKKNVRAMGINLHDLAAGSKVLDAWNELIDNKQSAGQGN